MFSRKTTDLIKFLKSFANKQRSVIFVFLVILSDFLRKKNDFEIPKKKDKTKENLPTTIQTRAPSGHKQATWPLHQCTID